MVVLSALVACTTVPITPWRCGCLDAWQHFFFVCVQGGMHWGSLLPHTLVLPLPLGKGCISSVSVDEFTAWAACVVCVCVWMVGDTICCLACPSLLIQCQLRQPGSSFLCYKTSGDAVVLLGSAVHKSPHPILHQLCPMQVPEWCTCPMKVRERCVPSHMQLVYHTVRTKTANKLRNTVRSHRGVARKLGPAP